MKLNGKKMAEFASEIGGCVVMGIISAATQTLWYRIAEPKILDAMDKNGAKQKHPIGFRGGGSPERAPLFFSADFANPFMEKNGYMQVKIL